MKEKILKAKRAITKEQMFLDVCFFIFGFVISFAKIAGVISCFCLAFAMAFKKRNSIFSFLGSLLGITIFLNVNSIMYFFILAIGAVLKIVFKSNSSLKNAILCAIAFLIPNTISIFLFPVAFVTLITIYFQTILCASITALCTQTSKNFYFFNKDRFHSYLGFFIALIAVLIAFCNLQFFSYNFGRFFCDFVVIQILVSFGINYSAAAGIFATIAFSLFTKDFSKFGVILTISGFLASVFKAVGKFFQIFMFVFIYIFCSMFFGGICVESLVEIFVAAFFSLIIPKNFLANFFNFKVAKNYEQKTNLNDEISLKLHFASNMLLELQNNIQECAKVMDSLTYKGMENVYDKISEKICCDCGLKTFCWVTSHSELMGAFSDASSFLRKNGSISSQSLPIFLRKKCCKLSNLTQYLNFLYKEQLCIEQNSRRINEVRSIAAEQFSGIADFLKEISGEIKNIKQIDENSARLLREAFNKENIEFYGVFCFLDEYDKTAIDFYIEKILYKEDVIKINSVINKVLEKNMISSSLTSAGDYYKISFFEDPIFNFDFAVKQKAAGEDRYCGDSYDYFIDSKGFAHIILSDGMGSGKRAALDSLMTCSTFRKFMESGFGFTSALKLLNLSFALKSKEESLATVDICTIDLYTGYTKFCKAGASISYVFTKGEILTFYSKSLPIGIIQGVGFDTKEINLSKGDIIVMVSDGAISLTKDYIYSRLKILYKQSSSLIAKELLNFAKENEDKAHEDDITVVVVKIN